MAPLIVLALIIAVLFGLSLVVKALLWVAVIAALVWIVGFLFRGSRSTWYRW